MECPRCGADLKYQTRFCPTCGNDVAELTINLEPPIVTRRGFWSTMEPEPEPEPQPVPEREPESGPELVPVPEPQQEPELEFDSELDAESESDPEREPQAEWEPEPELEPARDWEPDSELEHGPDSGSESEPESEPDPEWEPVSEPDRDWEPDSGPEFESEPEPHREQEPEPEPEPDPGLEESSNPYLLIGTGARRDEAPTPDDSAAQLSDESKPPAQRQLPQFVRTSLDFVQRDKRIKAAIIVVLAAAVSIFGFFQISSCVRVHIEQERVAAEQRRLGLPVDREVSVFASNFDAEHGTPIPLHVVGDAKNGTHVDEIMTMDARDPKLALLPGTYVVTSGGSLATEQGAFYYGSVDSYTVEVGDKASATGDGNDSATDGADTHAATKPVFAYELVAPEHVTDADLEALRAWMAAANVQDYQRYIDAVTARRAEAQQRIAEEGAARDEAERVRTEETAREVEEALQSNTQVGSDRASFSLPESWRGSVQTTQSVNASGYAVTIVHLPGNQYAELARVFFSSGYLGTGADGTLRHVAAYRYALDGTGHAEVQTLNWPLIAAMGAASQYGVSQAELYDLVSLSTGGALSYDYVRYAGGYDTSVSQAEPNFSAVAFSSLSAI